MQDSIAYHPFKPITINIAGVEKMIFLIAVTTKNSEKKEGFVLYQSNELKNWDRKDNRPLIDSVLFKTAEEAFEIGEEIIKNT